MLLLPDVPGQNASCQITEQFSVTTAEWIKKIRKSEELQDYLARQQITWHGGEAYTRDSP